jgi:hypothetical protein
VPYGVLRAKLARWQVDLGGTAQISHVNVWHRTDCCQDRLEAAKIFVSAMDPVVNGRFNPQGAQQCGQITDSTHAPEVATCTGSGRFVTVAHTADAGGTSDGIVITICEMEIWGTMQQPLQVLTCHDMLFFLSLSESLTTKFSSMFSA